MGRNYHFGNRVRNIMEEKGITKDELAERLGISERTARRYTSDSKVPGKCAIRKLSNALEVDPNLLLMKESDYKRSKHVEEESVEIVELGSSGELEKTGNTEVHRPDEKKPDVMMVWFGGIIYGYRDEH